jgi:ElaB/YqjD/DUF883 family membrane-anchored ribosome-binding protein
MESDMSNTNRIVAGRYDPSSPTTSAEHPKEQRSAQQLWDKGAEVLDQTKQRATEAYDKAAETLSHTYDQAMTYSRDNPGKFTLLAFGAGVGVGVLLAGSGGRRRTRRFAEPVVNALYDIALEFFRYR